MIRLQYRKRAKSKQTKTEILSLHGIYIVTFTKPMWRGLHHSHSTHTFPEYQIHIHHTICSNKNYKKWCTNHNIFCISLHNTTASAAAAIDSAAGLHCVPHNQRIYHAFSTLTLSVGHQEGQMPVQKPHTNDPQEIQQWMTEQQTTGFPLFYWQKIPGLFPDLPGPPWKIFQDLFGARECLNIKKRHLLTIFRV